MILFGQEILRREAHKNAPLQKWLANWAAVVENAVWHSLQDVRATYPKTDGVKLKSGFVVTVFNVKGNSFRLLASIDYGSASVEALEVLSHPEYDRNAWKARY